MFHLIHVFEITDTLALLLHAYYEYQGGHIVMLLS